jgi:hypothetical protein
VRQRRRLSGTPAVLVFFAALVAVAVPFLVREGWDDAWSARALASTDGCAGGDCLEQVDGHLGGPSARRRTVNVEWSLVDAGGDHHHFDLGPRASRRLHEGDPATALVYRGDVVAVVTADGARLRTLDAGAHGATVVGSWAVVAAALALVLAWEGRRRRRARGGWWRTSGPPAAGGPPAAVVVLVALAFAAGATFLALVFGAAWWVGLLAGAGVLVAFGHLGLAQRRPAQC